MKALRLLLSIGVIACHISWAQSRYTKLENLTSKIQNADFMEGSPVDAVITTYAMDLEDDGLGAGGTKLFGQQAVEGWTAVNLSNNIKTTEENNMNARAAGVMTYINDDSENVSYGLFQKGNIPIRIQGGPTRGLGVLAVWGATIQYTQEVTLPAGAYLIEIPVCNTAGTGSMTNINGFVADDGTKYYSKKQSFIEDAYTTTIDEIAFMLEKETKGVISLGYISGGQGSANSPHLFYSNVSLYKIDPTPLIADKIAAAKESLLELINYGEQIGADTRNAQAVYDKANATLEEVEAAIESQKAINESSLSDLSEFFINNPHFNQDDALPEGQGITTYDYDRSKNSVNYYGMQPVIGWTANFPAATIEENPLDKNTGVNNGRACGIFGIGTTTWLGGSQFIAPRTMSDGATSGNVLGFLTCWSTTTQYTQNVTIPAGKYTLTISYYNTGGTKDVAKNLIGFITNDGTEYLSEVTSFKTGSWEKMTVMFTLEEATSGKFSVGYSAANTGSGNMPHLFIDGISLYYIGDEFFIGDKYELNDGTEYKNSSTTIKKIFKYHRTFSNTNWQALYVPFSMSYDDWKDDFEVGKINDVNMYDTDDDGEFDVTEIELLKIKHGSTEANTPYFIKAKTTGDKVISLENVTLYPAEENYVDCSSTEMLFTFQGTYSGVSGADMYANRYYALSGGSLCYAEDSSVPLKPMRWYMKSEARNYKHSTLMNNVRLRVVGEDATGINETRADKSTQKATYMLDGRAVNPSNLKKGIYIRNGKKIVL